MRRLCASRLAARTLATCVLTGASAAAPPSASAYIYWNNAGNQLQSANVDGSNVQLVNGAPASSAGIASDGAHVYLAHSDDPTIGRVNPDGTGLTSAFVRLPSPTCSPEAARVISSASAVALDAQYIYWTDSVVGTIGRASIADGSNPNGQLLLAAGGMCGTSGGSGPGPEGLAVAGGYIYRTNPGTGTIGRANVDGSNPTQSFITGANKPWAVAVSGADVYWSNSGGPSPGAATIGHARLDSTGALIASSVNQSFITGITGYPYDPIEVTVFGDSLYFDNGDGWIGRASLDAASVDHHLLLRYREDPHPLAGLALDGGQASATATSFTCSPTSIQVLDPVPAQGDPLVAPLYEKTLCTFTVRDLGAPARPVSGTVAVSQSVPEGGFDSFVPDTCSVVPTPAAGVSKCSMTYRSDPHTQGFVFRAPQTTLSSLYGGETTHNGSAGGTSTLALQFVEACRWDGAEYLHVCDVHGRVVIGPPGSNQKIGENATGSSTRTRAFVLRGAGRAALTVPKSCVAAGHTFDVALAFSAGHGARLSLRRAAFSLGSGRATSASRRPFHARLTMPKRSRRAATLSVRLFLAGPHRRHLVKTIRLSIAVC